MKNTFNYLGTKSWQILKYIGFIIVYQFGSTIFYFATDDKPFGDLVTIIIWGVVVSVFTLTFIISRYREQLKKNNPFHFGKHKLTKKSILILIGLMALIMIVQITWSSLISAKFIIEPSNQQAFEQSVKQIPVISYLYIGIVAPLFEELICRGIFFNYFFNLDHGRLTQLVGIIICGLVFGYFHTLAFNLSWLFYSALGAIFSFAYVYFKDIRYNIIIHMLNNLIV